MRHRHDARPVATGPSEGVRRDTGHPERWIRSLNRLRIDRYLFRPPVRTVMAPRVLRPGFEDDVRRVVEAPSTLLPIDAEDLKIQRRVAQADAEVQPPTGEDIYHCIVFRNLNRMVEW